MGGKVLMIDGSCRRKNTYSILLQIGEILKTHGIESEIINLFDYDIKDCVGCEACVTKKSCCISDDMPIIMRKILESDGLVLGSPVYMSSVTSRFAAFADRTNIWVHKPETAGIPVMFAATTASTGLKETKRFLDLYATGFGARKGDFVTRSGRKMGEPVSESELSRFLTLLNQEKELYGPSMDELVMFTVGKMLALKSDGDDRQYWENKGWLDKRYYYPCKMNPFKILFSKFMHGVLSKAMR